MSRFSRKLRKSLSFTALVTLVAVGLISGAGPLYCDTLWQLC